MKPLLLLTILFALSACGNKPTDKENKSNKHMEMEEDASTILKIISSNPSYVPNQQQEQQAKALLGKMYPKNKIESLIKDTIEFVDQGQNFDSIICPFCGKDIETEYWQNAMERSEENHFKNLTMITPCCKKSTSLNDLRYVAPAGFAKFVLSISDPETEIKANDLATLQKILDTPLRTVYAHY